MAEEKKERWLTYMAVSTILIAVAATFSTFKGGGFSTRSLLNQTMASDQWAFYQSKSIKSYIYDMRRENLELQVATLEKQNGVTLEEFRIFGQAQIQFRKRLDGRPGNEQVISGVSGPISSLNAPTGPNPRRPTAGIKAPEK